MFNRPSAIPRSLGAIVALIIDTVYAGYDKPQTLDYGCDSGGDEHNLRAIGYYCLRWGRRLLVTKVQSWPTSIRHHPLAAVSSPLFHAAILTLPLSCDPPLTAAICSPPSARRHSHTPIHSPPSARGLNSQTGWWATHGHFRPSSPSRAF